MRTAADPTTDPRTGTPTERLTGTGTDTRTDRGRDTDTSSGRAIAATGGARRGTAAGRSGDGPRKPPFEQVVAEHGPMVLRVVRAVLGPDDAEDAWSETFLAALRAYPELPADTNVEAWLVTVAHRKAIDVTRANARRPAPVGAVPDRPARTGRPDDFDPDLWQALAALPDRQRQAVAYHYLAGLPYREIAALAGGSTDAARRAAADGMRTLRRTYPTSTEEP
ncbi:RNA polymerase sigma factor [Actinacidiphila rubida]|uniref:RNA polymerase sigma factor, sigma-70 family n=1 Tax=Actinacidiphila rubida TaxID=310780 RepID=A0A1H8QTW5_9ACTN|nr:sigma-70 family RNA polymerase sigma factor [Actinacidiphila rubida]SEO57401.1 RNA polymerase sigma factor, sigma-70 family [Actinacidiphila rubida]